MNKAMVCQNIPKMDLFTAVSKCAQLEKNNLEALYERIIECRKEGQSLTKLQLNQIANDLLLAIESNNSEIEKNLIKAHYHAFYRSYTIA